MNCELSCCLDVKDPELANVSESVQQLVGFLRDHGVTDDVFVGQFELAAAEAINNAVEHGCSASGEKFFHARLYLRPEFVELRVVDPSDFQGWDHEPLLPDDPFDEGGRGHYLMAQMTDELLHEREDNSHVLVLRKRFTSGPWCYIPGQADRTLSEMTDELVASYEMISTLVGLGEWLATAPNMIDFMDGALERLCLVTGAELAYVRLENRGTLKISRQWGSFEKNPTDSLDASMRCYEGEVFRTGQEITLPMNSDLPPNDPLAGIFVSGFIAPILFKDVRRGLLVLGRNVPSPFFDAGKLKISRTVAEYLGIISELGNLQKRKTEDERALRELEIAAQIQLSLMPREFSGLLGIDLYGTCRPALQAGGDYFDVLPLPDKSTLCVIADVMGKGLPAALLATMLRTTLHSVVASGNHDPGDLISTINALMSKDLINLEMFITMVCAWISPDRTQVRIASAGHLAGLMQSKSHPEKITEIEGAGMPLGIFHDTKYLSKTIGFDIGDRLLLYTDGIVEASIPDGPMFEVERVNQELLRNTQANSKDTLEALLEAVNTFTKGMSPSDDRTALLIARTH